MNQRRRRVTAVTNQPKKQIDLLATAPDDSGLLKVNFRLPEKAIQTLDRQALLRGLTVRKRGELVRDYLDEALSLDPESLLPLLLADVVDAAGDYKLVTFNITTDQSDRINSIIADWQQGKFDQLIDDNVDEKAAQFTNVPTRTAFVRTALYNGLSNAEADV